MFSLVLEARFHYRRPSRCGRSRAPAPAGYHHAVAIFQKAAALAIGQSQRLFAAHSEFYQSPGLVDCGAGQRARSQQVSGLQIAAVDSMVHHRLGSCPVGMAAVGERQAGGILALFAHGLGLEADAELHVNGAAGLVGSRIQIGQRQWITEGSNKRQAVSSQCFHADDPRR